MVGAGRRLGRRPRRRGARPLPRADHHRRGRPLAGRHRAPLGRAGVDRAPRRPRLVLARHARGHGPRAAARRRDRASTDACCWRRSPRPAPRRCSSSTRRGWTRRAQRCVSSLDRGEAPPPSRLAASDTRRRRRSCAWRCCGTRRGGRVRRACPARATTAGRCRSDPWIVEHARRVPRPARRRGRRPRRARCSAACAPSTTRPRRRSAPRRPTERRADPGRRGGARRRAAALPMGRRALRTGRPARVPGRRAGPGQDRRGARRPGGRRRLPGGRRLPRLAEAQLGAGGRALAAAPLGRRGSGPARGAPARRHHDPQLRDRRRAPRAARPRAPAGRSSSTSRTTARTRAPSARRRCAGSPRPSRPTGCASR